MTALSLAAHVAYQARLEPGAVAVIGPAGPVTRAALARDVAAAARLLAAEGVGPADRVGLALGASYLHLVLILACDRLGVASASLDGLPQPADPAALGLALVVAATARPAGAAGRWLTLADEHRPRLDSGAGDGLADRPVDAPPDAVGRIVWTARPGGDATPIALTRRVQARRIEVWRQALGLGPRCRALVGLPLSSAAGQALPLAALAAGGTAVLPAPAPDVFALAGATGVTHACVPAPQLARLVEAADRATGRLGGLERLDVIGAPVPPALIRTALQTLTPRLRLLYGTSETDMVSGGPATLGLDDPAAAGFVLPWCAVAIVDAAGRPLPAGQEGALRIRAPELAAGAAADPARWHDGWLDPGERGTLGDDGMLRLTGRVAA